MKLHPELRWDAWVSRYVGTPFVMALGAVFGVLAVKAFLDGLTFVGVVCAIIPASCAPMIHYCAVGGPRWYARLSGLMDQPAVPARVTAVHPGDEPPTVTIVLLQTSEEIEIPIYARTRAVPVDREVQAFVDPAPDGPVVLVAGSVIVWPMRNPTTRRQSASAR